MQLAQIRFSLSLPTQKGRQTMEYQIEKIYIEAVGATKAHYEWALYDKNGDWVDSFSTKRAATLKAREA